MKTLNPFTSREHPTSVHARHNALRHSALRHNGRRRGSVTMIVAACLVALLGFCSIAVDYGIISNDANQLQRAADAAALAGSQSLPNAATATAVAYDVAARNFVPNVSPNTVTVNITSVNGTNNRIQVICTRDRSMFFARIFGMNSKTLSRQAVAARAPALPPRIVPIGVTQATYNAMKANPTVPRLISYVRPVDSEYALDNFIVFDLSSTNGKSPSQMAKQLINGAFNVNIGDAYTSLNADGGPVYSNFETALSTIFQNSAKSPWFDTWTGNVYTSVGIRYTELELGTAPFDNPRVMRLVVNPDSGSPTGGGTWNVPIVDFAPVYVEAYSVIPQLNSPPKTVITVRLLTTGISTGGQITMVQ